MIEELLKTYDEQRAKFRPSDEVSIIVWKIDAFVERIRELEADNAKLLGVIGSMKDIVVMRDNMIGDFISDLQKAMNDQIRGVMDKTLTDVIRVTQEKLDA